MPALRRLLLAAWLAIVLVAGQQAMLAHDLAHASEKLSQKQDSKPASKCGDCFACAQLVAGAAATIPSVAIADGASAVAAEASLPAPASHAVPYLARGPPALS